MAKKTRTVSEPEPVSADDSRRNSPLVVFLTVLLILVGMIESALLGIAGYCAFQNSRGVGGGATVQSVPSGGTASNSGAASGGGQASDGAEAQEALTSYIQQMSGVLEQAQAVTDSFGSVSGTSYTDDESMYNEVSQNTIPLCQRLNEMALAITTRDAEISSLHATFRDYVTKMLNALGMLTSALSEQDAARSAEANDLINEANDLATSYQQQLQRLAQQRGVSLTG